MFFGNRIFSELSFEKKIVSLIFIIIIIEDTHNAKSKLIWVLRLLKCSLHGLSLKFTIYRTVLD